jgi:photosystem II stability/assembly factor-like uncharacterized protein
MHFTLIRIFFLIVLSNLCSTSPAKEVINKKFKFRVIIPNNWQSKNYKDGKDKIYEFVSPDENAFIQLRSFTSDPRLTIELLTKVFEESYLPKGNKKITYQKQKSEPGIHSARGSYSVQANGKTLVLTVYYIITKDVSHTLMTIIPKAQYKMKEQAIKNILTTFRITGKENQFRLPLSPAKQKIKALSNHHNTTTKAPVSKPKPTTLFKAIKISNVHLGDQITDNLSIKTYSSHFFSQTEKIYLSYHWEGEGAFGHTLKISWVYKPTHYVIDRSKYKFPASLTHGTNTIFISKPYGGWPSGEYQVEFSISGNSIDEIPFVIEKEKIKPPEQEPVSAEDLFAGVDAKSQVNKPITTTVSEPNPVTSSHQKTSKQLDQRKASDPSDIAAQMKFWANESLSKGKWSRVPFTCKSLYITNMSSAGIDYKASAVGQSTSSGYGPHIVQFSEGSRGENKIDFNYVFKGVNYYVKKANDIFALAGKYSNIWICGPKGMIMYQGALVKYKWVAAKTPTEQNLNSIYFANKNTGCAVGDYGTILMTHDGGKTWTQSQSPLNGTLLRVVFTDPLHAYILVRKTASLKGYLLKTTDGGRHWRVTEFPSQFQTPIEMAGMSFIDNNNGWICGKFGLVFHTTDGGESWNYVENARDAAGNKHLKDIVVTSNKEIWACGEHGTLIHSKNGGQSWEKLDLGEKSTFTSIEFNGPYFGYLSTSHLVYKYYDRRYDTYQGAYYKQFPRN